MKTELIDIFYSYYLKREKEKRDKAIELFNLKDHKTLKESYSHYLNIERKEKILTNTELNFVLVELAQIKDELPTNAANIYIKPVETEEEKFSVPYIVKFKSLISVSWCEYSICDEIKCESLAKHYAKEAAFKMEYQPTGIDGKSAIKLYDKLIKIIN